MSELSAVNKPPRSSQHTSSTSTTSSDLLEIANLEKEYDIALQKYQETMQTYIQELEDANSKNVFVSLPKRAWWGTAALKEGDVKDRKECEMMCASDLQCTGATFHETKKYCWTRTGDGALSVSADPAQTAIISKQTETMQTMKALNDELLRINQQLSERLHQLRTENTEVQEKKTVQYTMLSESRTRLERQQRAIQKQLDEYNTLVANNQDRELVVSQQTSLLLVWTIILAILVLAISTHIATGSASPAMVLFVVAFIIWYVWLRNRYV